MEIKESLIDVHTHIGVDILFYLKGYYPYAQDWPTLVDRGRAFGLSRFVVFPMISNFSLSIAGMRDGRFSLEGGLEHVPYALENRRHMVELTRRFPEYAGAALPFLIIDPSRRQSEQAEVLQTLGSEFKCYGLKIQATIIQSFVRDLLGSGACLLDVAEERNWSVLIHTSVHPDDPWSSVQDIIAVAKARPGVRFCLAHSCRFDRAALDQVAELPNAWFDCSAHRVHCQLAVNNASPIAPPERRFLSDFRNPAGVLHDLAMKYPSKLMWGSDAPFDSYVDDDFNLRSSYREEAGDLFALDAAARRRVASTNTLEFLNLAQ